MKDKNLPTPDRIPYTPLDFESINKTSQALADLIERTQDRLIDVLIEYESHEVAVDEISRTLDLLRHLDENEQYFKLRIGPVTSFLPRNQPLYAFFCFVVIPSFMASEVHFRIPHTMKHFFGDILKILRVSTTCPNIYVSGEERLGFLRERSALLKNPNTGDTIPVTDAVIFTGTLQNAQKLRLVFDKKTLFISNGAGHNPVVVSKDADLNKAVEAVTTLQFYNQGQDCAAPNAILVQKDIADQFMNALISKVRATTVGSYEDESSRIGPISEPQDLVRIQQFLVDHIKWIDPSTPGLINTQDSTVAPTIISKPLEFGGNFREMFAPILFVQQYEKDSELGEYFENADYAPNAMYVTLYGTSAYVQGLVGKQINGEVLHDKTTFVHNTHLHAPGVERGTQQYGGYGKGASSLSINGKTIAMPTLPQRDIYDWLVKPRLAQGTVDLSQFSEVVYRNVSKLLQIKLSDAQVDHEIKTPMGEIYLDTQLLKKSAARFLKVNKEEIYHLLQEPNTAYISGMEMKQIALIKKLRPLLKSRNKTSFDEFESKLYGIPKIEGASNNENRMYQKGFFRDTYQLLFGENNGPRLAEFLWSIDEDIVSDLIDAVDAHTHS